MRTAAGGRKPSPSPSAPLSCPVSFLSRFPLPAPQLKIHKPAGGDAKRGGAAAKGAKGGGGGGAEGGEFQDKEMACKDCGAAFTFTAGEQDFYKLKGFDNEPARYGWEEEEVGVLARMHACMHSWLCSLSHPGAGSSRSPAREEEDSNILRTPSEPV